MSHTPGPWYSRAPRANDAQGLVYAEGSGKNIAVTYDPKDAPLIAAAPDLLACCEDALRELSTGEEVHGLLGRLKLVIANAKGTA